MKYKCTNKPRFITFLVILTITLISIMQVKGEQPTQYKTITVQEGQGLFEIANDNYISNDLNREVYEIRKHNNLYGARYEPIWGQEIEIPVKENMRKEEK